MKLLGKGCDVTAIVRSADRLPAGATGHELLTVVVVPGGHLTLSDDAMAGHMRGEEDCSRDRDRVEHSEPCATSCSVATWPLYLQAATQ